MIILCVISLIILVIGFILWMVSWIVHISMNIDQNKPYDWCTFKTFKREFDKYKNKLHADDTFRNSIFLDKTVYLHASIIEFNDKCMILYPHSWLRYCIWKRRFVSNRQRGLWK